MPDNETTGTGKAVATDKVTYSGDADQNVQLLRPAHVTGTEGSKTVQDVTQSTGSAVPAAVMFVGGTDGTNARALKLDTSGEAQVDVLSIAAGDNNIGNVDVVTVPADPFGANADAASSTGSLSAKLRLIAGTVGTHDSPEAATLVKTGGSAAAGLAGVTLVADNDATDFHAGLDGVQVVRPHTCLEDIVTGNASNTDGTSFSVIAAGAAGVKHYLTQVTITNTSTAAIFCEIKDGTTAKWTIPVPAQGGATVSFTIPIPGTAATAWNCDPSAATTTVYCSMAAFKSKI